MTCVFAPFVSLCLRVVYCFRACTLVFELRSASGCTPCSRGGTKARLELLSLLSFGTLLPLIFPFGVAVTRCAGVKMVNFVSSTMRV